MGQAVNLVVITGPAEPPPPEVPVIRGPFTAPAAARPPVAYVLLDAAGHTVATVDHAEVATRTMNRTNNVESVRRASDGALIATKHRFVGDSFYGGLWAMKREPRSDDR